jgi:Zn-dependent protease/predicted transcriptional regulator
MTVAGIPFGVQPLWLLILGLMTWTLGADYYPARVAGIQPAAAYGLGLLSALLLFASIVAHEFGHAITARRRGVEVEGIDLWLLGGVAKMRGQARTPDDELRYSLAGPAVTLLIALVFGAVSLGLPQSAPAALRAVVEYQVYVNVVILAFNMLPAFPLDGGRVLRAALWRRSGDLRSATARAASVGRGFGWFFVFVGGAETLAGFVGGVWLMIIGFFVLVAARAESRHAEVATAFRGYRAADLMSAPAVTIGADWTLEDAARAFEHYRFTSFPVIEDGRVIGLLLIDALAAMPRQRWRELRVGELADRDPSLLVAADDELINVIDGQGFARDGRAVVVAQSGAPTGIVSLTDLDRALRAMRLHARSQGAGT